MPLEQEQMLDEEAPPVEGEQLPEQLPEEMPAEDPAMEEKLGSQILRRMYEDIMILMEDYDRMLGPLEEAAVKEHVMAFLSNLEACLTDTEELHEGVYAPEGYEPLNPMAANEVVETSEEEAAETSEEQVVEGEAPVEEEYEGSEENEPTEEEAYEGMQESEGEEEEVAEETVEEDDENKEKALSTNKTKAMCEGCGEDPCSCNEKSMSGRRHGVGGRPLRSPRAANVAGEKPLKLRTEPWMRDEVGPTREPKEEPWMRAEAGESRSDDKEDWQIDLSKELGTLIEAKGFLNELKDTNSTSWGEAFRKKCYYHGVMLQKFAPAIAAVARAVGPALAQGAASKIAGGEEKEDKDGEQVVDGEKSAKREIQVRAGPGQRLTERRARGAEEIRGHRGEHGDWGPNRRQPERPAGRELDSAYENLPPSEYDTRRKSFEDVGNWLCSVSDRKDFGEADRQQAKQYSEVLEKALADGQKAGFNPKKQSVDEAFKLAKKKEIVAEGEKSHKISEAHKLRRFIGTQDERVRAAPDEIEYDPPEVSRRLGPKDVPDEMIHHSQRRPRATAKDIEVEGNKSLVVDSEEFETKDLKRDFLEQNHELEKLTAQIDNLAKIL